jgi:acyl carrier protein
MDPDTRSKRIEALEAIKNKALSMANQGADSLEVRNFVVDAKKELAYELPDQEAFTKAMNATLAYKAKKGN